MSCLRRLRAFFWVTVAFGVGIFVGSRQESGLFDLAFYGGKDKAISLGMSTVTPESSSRCRTDMSNKKVKSVVIAMAVGTYTIVPFKIFVGSLRQHYSGDV